MKASSLVQTVRRQLNTKRGPSPEHIASLLELIEQLEKERKHEREMVLQANLDQRAYRALVAANDALIATRHVDATQRRRAEEALRESEDRFRVLFEHSPDSILLIDPHDASGEWPIVDCNKVACRLNGYTREELLGQGIDLLHPEPAYPGEREAYLARLRAEGTIQTEAIHQRKDGSFFPVEISATLITINGRELMLGVDRDISERRRNDDAQRFLAEVTAALQSSLDYHATLQSVANLAVPYLADWCAVITVEDDEAVKLVALQHRDGDKVAESRAVLDRYQFATSPSHGIGKVLSTGKPDVSHGIEPELLRNFAHSDEHLEWLSRLNLRSSMNVPMIARDRLVGVIALVTAESGRVYDERDLDLAMELARRAALAVDNARLYHEAQQALRSRDDFLSIAAHELKAPLTTLFGSTRMLQHWAAREEEEGRHALEVLALAESAAQNLEKLIDSLIDLSRIQSGRFNLESQPVDLCALVRLVVEETQTAPKHHIELQCADDTVVVEGDESRLELVLHNLLGNALKYSPSGGRVRLAIERNADEACLTISDEGIGIPREAQPHVFDRYFRASNADLAHIGGTGIGLYLVREIVARHQGAIEVASREGEGSTFSVRLPLWKPRFRLSRDAAMNLSAAGVP